MFFSFPYAFLHANILLISQNYVFGSLLLMCCHSVCVHFLVWSLICSDQRHQASLYPHISKSGLLLQFCTVGLSAKIFVLQKMTCWQNLVWDVFWKYWPEELKTYFEVNNVNEVDLTAGYVIICMCPLQTRFFQNECQNDRHLKNWTGIWKCLALKQLFGVSGLTFSTAYCHVL